MEEGIELIEVEAAKLCNNTTLVLTTEAIQAIAAAKNIAKEDKKQAKII